MTNKKDNIYLIRFERGWKYKD